MRGRRRKILEFSKNDSRAIIIPTIYNVYETLKAQARQAPNNSSPYYILSFTIIVPVCMSFFLAVRLHTIWNAHMYIDLAGDYTFLHRVKLPQRRAGHARYEPSYFSLCLNRSRAAGTHVGCYHAFFALTAFVRPQFQQPDGLPNAPQTPAGASKWPPSRGPRQRHVEESHAQYRKKAKVSAV